ncbi:MAG TPA: hypothetical protein VKU62_01265 [Thermoanaerobaculia bacterium]|nr:hypothetical protein [Thermoanaerobaculia bacterium]
MTWKEFKAKIEALGVKDDDEIWYVDLPKTTADSIRAEKDKTFPELGWAISDVFGGIQK